MNQEKKLTGHESWIRFRNRVIAGLGIFALITLYFSFYFVGPIKVTVIDAKTDKPIANIEVWYTMRGNDALGYIFGGLNPGGSMGWSYDREGYTDDKGIFKIPVSIMYKIPFIMFLDSKRNLVINVYGESENKNYDHVEQEFVWFPFRSFKFALVPTPETLDDCRDNLTEEEQYRCVKMLAERDAREINKLKYNYDYGSMDNYFLNKYLHILKNRCEETQNLPSTNRIISCDAVLAALNKDKNMCNNDKYCLYSVAVDLKDVSWCKDLPIEKDIKDIYDISQEKCEYIINALTAEEK